MQSNGRSRYAVVSAADDAVYGAQQPFFSSISTLLTWVMFVAILVALGLVIAALFVLDNRIDDMHTAHGPAGPAGPPGPAGPAGSGFITFPFLTNMPVFRVNSTNLTTATYLAGSNGFHVLNEGVGSIEGADIRDTAAIVGSNYFINQIAFPGPTIAATCTGIMTISLYYGNGSASGICTITGRGAYIYTRATGVAVLNNANYEQSETLCTPGTNLTNSRWLVNDGLLVTDGGFTLFYNGTLVSPAVESTRQTLDLQCAFDTL